MVITLIASFLLIAALAMSVIATLTERREHRTYLVAVVAILFLLAIALYGASSFIKGV